MRSKSGCISPPFPLLTVFYTEKTRHHAKACAGMTKNNTFREFPKMRAKLRRGGRGMSLSVLKPALM